MADETLRFDIIGNDSATGAFSRVGGSVKDMGDRMNIATKQALVLDEALKRQQTAARSSVDATLALAKADDILADAEHVLRDGALEAELALKKETEAKKQSGAAALDAAAKNEAFRKSLNDTASSMRKGGGPSWLGPALLAAPVATSVAGVGAGAAIGLGGAFATSAIALAAYGVVAKSVLSQASTATQAVQTAQVAYNAAIENGTKKAVAYKAEQIAIAKAYAGMSPAQIQLSKELGQISDQWSKFKQSVTPMIASSLQPWLKGVGLGLQSLRSLITPMGPVVHGLGADFGTLMNSSTFRTFSAWVGTTGAAVTRSAGGAVLDLLTGMTFLLPQFTPLITGAANGIAKWGTAFVKWSASQKAADQIHSFLDWFHTNGPVVGQLIKNMGAALAALAPGIGTASVGELKVISQFFAFVAKLPPGLAKPIAETAAVLLTLNKLGVVTVGLKLAGLGTGGAAAGAAASTGLWSKMLPGVRLAGGVLAATVAVDMVLKSTSSGSGKNWLDNPFGQGVSTNPKTGKQTGTPTALTSFQTLGHDIMHDWDMTWQNVIGRANRGSADTIRILSGWEHNASHWFDTARHDVAASWNTTWNNTIARGQRGLQDSDHYLGIWRHDTAHWFDLARGDVAAIWNTVWNNTVSRTARGVDDVSRWVNTLPGTFGRTFSGAGWWLFHAGQDVIQGLWNGLANIWSKVTGWISSLAGWIKSHKGPVSFDRTLLEPAGRAIMTGLRVGLEGGFVGIKDIVSGMAGNIGNQFSGLVSLGGKIGGFFSNLVGGSASGGVMRWSRLVSQALAMLGLPQGLASRVLFQMQSESGGNPNAINLTDINAQEGDPSRGLMQVIATTFAADHVPGTSYNIYDPLANIAAAINYAWGRYGPTLMSGGMGIGSGHGYALGTMSAAPGWGWVGERGPELMHFRGGEQVVPAGRAGGNSYSITVNVAPGANPAEFGRVAVAAIRQYEKRSGKGWRS